MAATGLALALDVRQGYNFDKNQQIPCGFVTKLKIGDAAFEADQAVRDTLSPESDLQVVGVLRSYEWDTSITGSHFFEMQVSVKGKQKVKQLLLKDMTKINVEVEYAIYDFDSSDAQAFFKQVHTNEAVLKGVVQKQNGNFVLNIRDIPSQEVAQPENYLLTMGFHAQGKQDVHMATSTTAKFVKQTGITT